MGTQTETKRIPQEKVLEIHRKAMETQKQQPLRKFETILLQVLRHPDATANGIMEAREAYVRVYADLRRMQEFMDKHINPRVPAWRQIDLLNRSTANRR